MKLFKFNVISILMSATLIASCGGGGKDNSLTEGAAGDMEAYENSDVNAIEQARPQIMVLPSDNTLKQYKALSESRANGRTYYLRDYAAYLKNDYHAKRILSAIQDEFNKLGYPLNDLDQTLKQLDTQEATDMADDLGNDAKTRLLTIAQPDIILELDYYTSSGKIGLTSHNYSNKGNRDVSYTLNALDAYTNKVVATINATGLNGESTTQLIQEDIINKMPKFQQDIQNYFSDILKRGRDITVRISVENGCDIKLSDESVEGDTYADYIIDYMKSHTVKGAYKLQRNTDKELYFVNCRIKLLNEDGTQYGVYDWTRSLAKKLRKELGLKVANKAQGLGEMLLTIKGM